jgi:hypothetical protein
MAIKPHHPPTISSKCLCVSRLPAGEQESFMAQLTDLVGTADPEAAGDEGLPQNYMQSLDRGRSGRRGAADRQMAQDRALRERNSRSFDQRWGTLMSGVSVDMMRSNRR